MQTVEQNHIYLDLETCKNVASMWQAEFCFGYADASSYATAQQNVSVSSSLRHEAMCDVIGSLKKTIFEN
jgi:hypothetical protein